MSTCVCGIVCTDIHDVDYEVKLAFYFEKIANEYSIGTKMGGNISDKVYKKYTKTQGKGGIVFELTDSPLDNNAENLFWPNDFGGADSLQCRIQRIQNLFERLLGYKHVTKIVFETNYLFDDGNERDSIVVSQTDFCTKFTQFCLDCVFVPVLKFEITR